MEKLNITDIAGLPVTDLWHTTNEINVHRRWMEAKAEHKRRLAAYNQQYHARH